jgi:hypothetical protein
MSGAPIDGLAALTDRVERAKRSVPPPRRPRAASDPAAEQAPGTGADQARALNPVPDDHPTQPGLAAGDGQQRAPSRAQDALVKALAEAPTVMLGARIRVPLDDLLNDLVHEARHHQVRTSKVELVELALLSLAGVDPAAVAERVREFRNQTGRYMVRR